MAQYRITLKGVQDLYLWTLTQFQAFSMGLHDSKALSEDQILYYCMDGYDLTNYLFPAEFFTGIPNTYHGAIKSNWEHFFSRSVPDAAVAVLTPFSIYEMLSRIIETSSDNSLRTLLSERYVDGILKDILNGDKKLSDIDCIDQNHIRKLYNAMLGSNIVSKLINEGEPFAKLKEGIDSKQILFFDQQFRNYANPDEISPLLTFDNKNIERAVQYLRSKRTKAFSARVDGFHNFMDVCHYVLVENANSVFSRNNINAYITSSGVLSRNSWMLTKYGKILGATQSIPDDWSARASNVPTYIAEAYQRFHSDRDAMQDFFEEGRVLSRLILKDLLKIEQLRECVTDAKKRVILTHENPEVPVDRRVAQAIMRFQNDYHHTVSPDHAITPVIQTNRYEETHDDIDIEALLKWIRSPFTRSQRFEQVKQNVANRVNELELTPLDFRAYIAPLGEDTFDIVRTFSEEENKNRR